MKALQAEMRGGKIAGLVTNCTPTTANLLRRAGRAGKWDMRALALALVGALILFGVYQFYLKKMPTTDTGTASTQAINLTGVRMDLLQIAQAERGNMALNSNCASLDELISSGSLSMSRSGRDGYKYEIGCRGGAEFQVIGRHAPAPEGSPIRYPTLAIDSSMQVSEIQ